MIAIALHREDQAKMANYRIFGGLGRSWSMLVSVAMLALGVFCESSIAGSHLTRIFRMDSLDQSEIVCFSAENPCFLGKISFHPSDSRKNGCKTIKYK